MNTTFDDRWLGLWVCDDGRAVEIRRSADALALSVTDARGAPLAELVGAVVAPDPVRARDPHSLPNVRMATVRAEVGEGICAQTWQLYLAALDTAPDARFRYRPARADDDLASVQLLPECGASLLEIVSDDPWTNEDYGTIPWALPYLPFTHVNARTTPHPLVAPPSSYWKVTVSDAPPGELPGRAVDVATARVVRAPLRVLRIERRGGHRGPQRLGDGVAATVRGGALRALRAFDDVALRRLSARV